MAQCGSAMAALQDSVDAKYMKKPMASTYHNDLTFTYHAKVQVCAVWQRHLRTTLKCRAALQDSVDAKYMKKPMASTYHNDLTFTYHAKVQVCIFTSFLFIPYTSHNLNNCRAKCKSRLVPR